MLPQSYIEKLVNNPAWSHERDIHFTIMCNIEMVTIVGRHDEVYARGLQI